MSCLQTPLPIAFNQGTYDAFYHSSVIKLSHSSACLWVCLKFKWWWWLTPLLINKLWMNSLCLFSIFSLLMMQKYGKQTCSDRRPCEDTEKRAIYKPRKEVSEKTQLTLWYHTSSLQKCEKVNFCHFSYQTNKNCFLEKSNETGKALIIKNYIKQMQNKIGHRDKTYDYILFLLICTFKYYSGIYYWIL